MHAEIEGNIGHSRELIHSKSAVGDLGILAAHRLLQHVVSKTLHTEQKTRQERKERQANKTKKHENNEKIN